jgi:hypothetical protein
MMNKKVLSIVLALAITLCLSIVVMANTAAPSRTVNIDPIEDLAWDQEDLPQEVTGYVEFDSSNDGPMLETLALKVQKDGSKEWTTIDSKDYTASTGSSVKLTERSDDQGLEFNFDKDWTIKEEGTYKLRVIATFTDLFSKEQANITVEVTPDADEAVVEIEDLGEDEELDEDDDADTLNEEDGNCPAAPAVAGKILKAHNVKNHYAGGNFIADVAKEMGPNGEFRGVQKSHTAEYQAEIEDFLEEQGAFEEEITEETQQNQPDKKPKHNQK